MSRLSLARYVDGVGYRPYVREIDIPSVCKRDHTVLLTQQPASGAAPAAAVACLLSRVKLF